MRTSILRKIGCLFFATVISSMTLAVAQPDANPDALYLIGDGTEGGWDTGKTVTLTKVENTNDNRYAGVCRLFPHGNMNEGFKILTRKIYNIEDWNYGYASSTHRAILTPGTEYDIVPRNETDDNKWIVAQDGTYLVEVNLDTKKIKITDFNMYICGDATTVGWDPYSAIEKNSLENNIIVWNEISLEVANTFRFFTKKEWFNLEYHYAENFTYDQGKGLFTGKIIPRMSTSADKNFKLPLPASDGTYKITCDMNTLTVTAELVKSEFDILYLIGDATTASWDITSGVPLVQHPNNQVEYSTTTKITLTTTGDFKIFTRNVDEAGKDWWDQPSFFREDDNDALIINDYRPISPDSDGDRKWTVAVGGDYYVTVDLKNNTIILRESIPTQTFIWTGAKNNDWDDAENWKNATDYPKTSDYNVLIPKVPGYASYPKLTLPTDAECNTITFEHGAELGGQDLLDYNNAIVQMDLAKGRWHMLSMPIATTLNNFNLRENDDTASKTWYRRFAPDGSAAKWDYIQETSEPVGIGEGFSFWIESSANDLTRFMIEGELADNGMISRTINFGKNDVNDNTETPFAYVGNPYMTAIDYDALRSINGNDNIISENYVIHNGDYFIGYSTDGTWGPIENPEDKNRSDERAIAPLQAFIVEAATGVSGSRELKFSDIGTIQATGESSGLRNSTSVARLDIIADNGSIPVLTFISNREDAQSARKLKSGINTLPDVYTLTSDKTIAFGAQLINTENITTVPVGIATTSPGNMSLTFSGMQDFEGTKIELIDLEENERVELSGESSQYDFEFVPPKDDKENILPCENRFVIAFTPRTITDIKQTNESGIAVYAEGNVINLISGADNFIRQVYVYDMQGRMLHTKADVNDSICRIDLLDKSDMYIVKIVTETGLKSIKVIP